VHLLFIYLDLFILFITTLFSMLSVNKLTNSPAGTCFMLPEAALEVNRRECWPESLRVEYKHYLERSGNKSILTG
jgi:hypothetical protein